MTEQAMKKEWIKPELIVLVRSKPEEAVLVTCKYDVQTDPYNIAVYCTIDDMCNGCLEMSPS